MKKSIKKFITILLVLIMGLSFTYTSYPVYAQESIETTSVEQTENSVAKVGDTYYDDLAEALYKAAETGETCDLLQDATITGNHKFDILSPGVLGKGFDLNLNGFTIDGSSNLKFAGAGQATRIYGPGTINANITESGNFPADSPIVSKLDGNELINENELLDLKGIAGQPLSTVSLPKDWSWMYGGEVLLSPGEFTWVARFNTTDYEMEYDFTNVVGYNQEEHYVKRNLTVNVSEEDIAKVVKPDGTEVLYSDIVDAFAGAENSTLYLLKDVEYDQRADSQFRALVPAKNMILDTNNYTLTCDGFYQYGNLGNPNLTIIGNGKDKIAMNIKDLSSLTTTLSNAKIEVNCISRGSLYVESDSSVVGISDRYGDPYLTNGANLYLEEGAELIGDFELSTFSNTKIYTNVQPDTSKYKLEVPTNLELGKTYDLKLSEVFLNHGDIVNKGKVDVSISGIDKDGYITMKNDNDIAYLPISIKDIDSLTNDIVILNAEHRNPEKDEAQHYNGNGQDSTSITIGDKLIKDVSNPNSQEKLTHGTYTGTLKIKNNIDDSVKEIIVVHEVSHNYNEEWVKDENKHWHECECGAKVDEESHTFEWVVDKEATHAEKGSKHEECSVCGYEKASVEIPVLTPSNPEKPNTDKPNTDKPNNDKESVETGDPTNVGLFISLSMISVLGIAVFTRQKRF